MKGTKREAKNKAKILKWSAIYAMTLKKQAFNLPKTLL